jgi:hypothetical protein
MPTPDSSPSSAASASLLGTPSDLSPYSFGHIGLKPDYTSPSASFEQHVGQPGFGFRDRVDGGGRLPFDVSRERILGMGTGVGLGLSRDVSQAPTPGSLFRHASHPGFVPEQTSSASGGPAAYGCSLLEPYSERPSPMQLNRPLPSTLPNRPLAAEQLPYQAALAMHDRSLSGSLWSTRAPAATASPLAQMQLPSAEWYRSDEHRADRPSFADIHARSASLQSIQSTASTAFSGHSYAHPQPNALPTHGHGHPNDVRCCTLSGSL